MCSTESFDMFLDIRPHIQPDPSRWSHPRRFSVFLNDSQIPSPFNSPAEHHCLIDVDRLTEVTEMTKVAIKKHTVRSIPSAPNGDNAVGCSRRAPTETFNWATYWPYLPTGRGASPPLRFGVGFISRNGELGASLLRRES